VTLLVNSIIKSQNLSYVLLHVQRTLTSRAGSSQDCEAHEQHGVQQTSRRALW
jgi:hypothetical protein